LPAKAGSRFNINRDHRLESLGYFQSSADADESRHPQTFGVRRQSEAATALWMNLEK
jgi:hypothetical protein